MAQTNDIGAATIERLAIICMALKCYADGANFKREVDRLLGEIRADERRHCEAIVRDDRSTVDVLKECIQQTCLVDRYAWLLGRLQ